MLSHAEKFAPEYGRFGFSDHWPMERFARASMGAGEADLAKRKERTTARLDPLRPPASGIDVASDFAAHLGDRQTYTNYLDLFRRAIAADGIDGTLAQYWPQLEPGLCAAALHGIIRLAFGLEANDSDEIAAGLAYTASANARLDLDAARPATNRDAAIAAMQACIDHPATQCFAGKSSISARIEAATRQPELRTAFLETGLPEKYSLADIRRFALDLYRATGDFAALHTLTGTHAARIVCEHVRVSPLLPARLWSGILAIHLTIGAPELSPLPVGAATDWPALFTAALASDDAHDVKLVYSAHAEWQHTGEADYLQAAQLRLYGRAAVR